MPISIYHTCALIPLRAGCVLTPTRRAPQMCGFGSRSALSHGRAKRDGRLELQGGDAGTTGVSWEANRQFNGAEPCPDTTSCPRVGSDSRQWGQAAHSSCEPMTHNNNFRVTANLPDFICRCTDERRCQNPNKERLMLRLILFPQLIKINSSYAY